MAYSFTLHVADVESFIFAQLWSLKSCSSLREPTSVSLLNLRSSSSARVFSLMNMTRYSTYSNDDSCPSGKRRSRGPVMAAKKRSEGRECDLTLLDNMVF